MTEIAKRADIVIGVKSAYEKTGVYVNAMRRLHLSQPLVECDLPDDWEVLNLLAKKLGDGENFTFESSEDVWNEVRSVAPRRFSGAAYYRLERHRKRGMQWPIYHEDTPILHLLDFRTEDGLGHFVYQGWKKRGMVEEILEGEFYRDSPEGYYLTTGRILAHYNNAAQTRRSKKLDTRHDEDVLWSHPDERERLGDRVILRSLYGESEALKVAYSDAIRPRTLFTTFHHANSRINALFGDESDELILTARFKSVKVEVIPVGEAWGGS